MSKDRLSIPAILVLMAPVVFVYQFSTSPAFTYHSDDEARLIVSFKKMTDRLTHCTEAERQARIEEAKTRRKHMRRQSNTCGSREKIPLDVEVFLDGKAVFSKRHYPVGFHGDGFIYVYKRFDIPKGKTHLKTLVTEYREDGSGASISFEEDVDFSSREVKVLGIHPEKGNMFFL